MAENGFIHIRTHKYSRDFGESEILGWTTVTIRQWQGDYMSYENTKHPFTQIQITDKGLEELAKIVENVRNMVGYDIPLSTDHFGHFDLNNGIRLGRALEKYRLAWMEDIVSWELD